MKSVLFLLSSIIVATMEATVHNLKRAIKIGAPKLVFAYIDLYVTAGDSDSVGGDIAVSNGSWTLDFYFYSSGVTARYYNRNEKVVNLNCAKANF